VADVAWSEIRIGFRILTADRFLLGRVESVTPTFLLAGDRGTDGPMYIPLAAVLHLGPGYVALRVPTRDIGEETWKSPPLDTGFTGLPPL
jgi:hypothetical protein